MEPWYIWIGRGPREWSYMLERWRQRSRRGKCLAWWGGGAERALDKREVVWRGRLEGSVEQGLQARHRAICVLGALPGGGGAVSNLRLCFKVRIPDSY